jgi:hypothetical protein
VAVTSSAVERLRAAVLTSPGALDAELRAAAFQGGILPEPLRTYAAKVAARAYQATDADVDALRAAGYSEDQIFEATVCVAVGVGLRQLERGLSAMGGRTQA